MKTAIVVLVVLGVAGCARFDPCEGATYCLDEVGVYVESDLPWLHAADTEARIRRTIDVTAGYWGAERLAGVRIHFMDANACGGAGGGCTAFYDPDGWTPADSDYTYKRIEFDSAQGLGLGHCVESTPLEHEMGHVPRQDPYHADSRWAGQVALYHEYLAPASLYPDCY
jgi:hypothetical protein